MNLRTARYLLTPPSLHLLCCCSGNSNLSTDLESADLTVTGFERNGSADLYRFNTNKDADRHNR